MEPQFRRTNNNKFDTHRFHQKKGKKSHHRLKKELSTNRNSNSSTTVIMTAPLILLKRPILVAFISLSLMTLSRNFFQIFRLMEEEQEDEDIINIDGSSYDYSSSFLYRTTNNDHPDNNDSFHYLDHQTGKLIKWHRSWGPPPIRQKINQQQQRKRKMKHHHQQQDESVPVSEDGGKEHQQQQQQKTRHHDTDSGDGDDDIEEEDGQEEEDIHIQDLVQGQDSIDHGYYSDENPDDNLSTNNHKNNNNQWEHPKKYHQKREERKKKKRKFPPLLSRQYDEDNNNKDQHHHHHRRGIKNAPFNHRFYDDIEEERQQDVVPMTTTSFELKLPKPIIVMGFPKAGTSSIFTYFRHQGIRSQHWYCCRQQRHPQEGGPALMAGCMLRNMAIASKLAAAAAANSTTTTTTTNSSTAPPSPPSILENCGNFDVYSELNGPRRQKKKPKAQQQQEEQEGSNSGNGGGNGGSGGYFGIPGSQFTKKRRLGVLLEDGTYDYNGPTTRLFFPQHFYIHKLHDHAPNATWILNLRNVDDWVKSVLNWGDDLASQFANEYYMQQSPLFFYNKKTSSSSLLSSSLSSAMLRKNTTTTRGDVGGDDAMYENHHPNHPQFEYPITNDTIMAHFLKTIYQHHHDMVREFVQQHPSHTLIEINITDDSTGQILSDAFGLNSTKWGHVNKNTGRHGPGPSSQFGDDGPYQYQRRRRRSWRAYQQHSWYLDYMYLEMDEIYMWIFVIISAVIVGYCLGTCSGDYC